MDSERGGYLRGGSHLPWSKPQFGVKVGKRSQFHLESRLPACSPGLQKKMSNKILPSGEQWETVGGGGGKAVCDVSTRLPGAALSRAKFSSESSAGIPPMLTSLPPVIPRLSQGNLNPRVAAGTVPGGGYGYLAPGRGRHKKLTATALSRKGELATRCFELSLFPIPTLLSPPEGYMRSQCRVSLRLKDADRNGRC